MRLTLALLLLLAAPTLSAQDYVPRDERGSLGARAETDLDGNDVLATVYNFGQSGWLSAGQQTPYEWPAGTNQRYIALAGLFVGAEVVSETGEPTFIVNIPNYRQDLDAPDEAWTWIPVPEYAANGEIARSDRPETWPAVWPDRLSDVTDPGWPGSWNGLLGKGAVIEGVETYTHYTDDQYDRNRQTPSRTYLPDPADPERAGLGLVVSERRLAFADASVQDAQFVVRDIYNASPRDLNSVGATVWVADYVGGAGDSEDDTPVFDAKRRLIVFGDADGESANPAFPDGQSVGAAALVLLEAPEDSGFENVQHRPAGAFSFQSVSDSFLYASFMVPAAYVPPPSPPNDLDTFASVGLFDLAAGASARLATAFVFGEVDYSSADPVVRYAELLAKAEAARTFYAGGFVTAGEGGAPVKAVALQAVPNPFASEVRLSFALPTAQTVRVEVVDTLGRRVAMLADAAYPAGSHRLTWGGRSSGAPVANGVYLVRLTTAGGVQTRTVSLAR